jgi:hypothetical protein
VRIFTINQILEEKEIRFEVNLSTKKKKKKGISSCKKRKDAKPIDVAGKSVTAVSRAWGWKTCKTKKLIGKGHRFGAGLGGSDAFVSTSCQRKLESLIL